MTRSVELPEEAVNEAWAVLTNHGHGGNGCDPTDHLTVSVRAALAAALPYLVPAESVCYCPPHPNPEYSTPGDWNPSCPVHQPAGDGGLREALEDLAGIRSGGDGHDLIVLPSELRSLLAAHPAAPAVPQPATLPTCVNCESETFECSACGSLVEPWGSAVPQPVDREAWRERIENVLRGFGMQVIVERGIEDSTVSGAADAVLALFSGGVE